jgi:hypothetical protein
MHSAIHVFTFCFFLLGYTFPYLIASIPLEDLSNVSLKAYFDTGSRFSLLEGSKKVKSQFSKLGTLIIVIATKISTKDSTKNCHSNQKFIRKM